MRHAFGVRVQKVQRVLKVQRVVVSPSAMSIKAIQPGFACRKCTPIPVLWTETVVPRDGAPMAQ